MWVRTSRPTPARSASSPASRALMWPRSSTGAGSGSASVASAISTSAPARRLDQPLARAAVGAEHDPAAGRVAELDRVGRAEVRHRVGPDRDPADLELVAGLVLLDRERAADQVLAVPGADETPEERRGAARGEQPRLVERAGVGPDGERVGERDEVEEVVGVEVGDRRPPRPRGSRGAGAASPKTPLPQSTRNGRSPAPSTR